MRNLERIRAFHVGSGSLESLENKFTFAVSLLLRGAI